MEHVARLPEKLDMALKALSLSRVGLAQRLAVDKSLVGRWLAGSVHPTEHNLTRLAALVAEHLPGFRLADWYDGLDALALRLGVERKPEEPATGWSAIPEPLAEFLDATRPELMHRGAAYEGFWRSTRPSMLVGDRLFHEYGMIRRSPDGLIEVFMVGSGLDFAGWVFPSHGNLFTFMFDRTGRTPISALFKGVSLPRAMVLDGVLTLAGLDPDRTPVVLPVIIERVADLSGDRDADYARFLEMRELEPAAADPLPIDVLEARLRRDVGPAAAARGGEAFLSVGGAHSLSRGVSGRELRG